MRLFLLRVRVLKEGMKHGRLLDAGCSLDGCTAVEQRNAACSAGRTQHRVQRGGMGRLSSHNSGHEFLIKSGDIISSWRIGVRSTNGGGAVWVCG